MLKQLSYKKKNRILILVSVILLFLSWKLSFEKTYDAITLNHDLVIRSQNDKLLAYNPSYLAEKAQLLNNLLVTYTADSALWQNNFWLTASGFISSDAVKVIYEPEQKFAQDSIGQICQGEITFESDYKKLVITLDSFSKIKALGYLTSARIQNIENREKEDSEKLRMKVILSIVKSDP